MMNINFCGVGPQKICKHQKVEHAKFLHIFKPVPLKSEKADGKSQNVAKIYRCRIKLEIEKKKLLIVLG